MTTTPDIRAQVVDLRADTPRADDRFVVDTNAWFWAVYDNAKQASKSYQATAYPTYIDKVLKAGGTLLKSDLNLYELTHVIERTERSIYETLTSRAIETKAYRRLNDQRTRVTDKLREAWSLVGAMAEDWLPAVGGEQAAAESLALLTTTLLDGYDVGYLVAMRQAGVTNIITDDGDFLTVPEITVFTANNGAINRARDAGRLQRR